MINTYNKYQSSDYLVTTYMFPLFWSYSPTRFSTLARLFHGDCVGMVWLAISSHFHSNVARRWLLLNILFLVVSTEAFVSTVHQKPGFSIFVHHICVGVSREIDISHSDYDNLWYRINPQNCVDIYCGPLNNFQWAAHLKCLSGFKGNPALIYVKINCLAFSQISLFSFSAP